jgi:hypothetical protein
VEDSVSNLSKKLDPLGDVAFLVLSVFGVVVGIKLVVDGANDRQIHLYGIVAAIMFVLSLKTTINLFRKKKK